MFFLFFFFFFNDTATTEIYTLSLHDALPISTQAHLRCKASSACWWWPAAARRTRWRSEEHTSELQSLTNLVCRLLLEKKKKKKKTKISFITYYITNTIFDYNIQLATIMNICF